MASRQRLPVGLHIQPLSSERIQLPMVFLIFGRRDTAIYRTYPALIDLLGTSTLAACGPAASSSQRPFVRCGHWSRL